MDINGGDKNRVFLHDLIKITEGTVSEGTIFMHIGNLMTRNGNDVNLLKFCSEKIVKSHQCNLFSARFGHLEPIMWQPSTLWHQCLYL